MKQSFNMMMCTRNSLLNKKQLYFHHHIFPPCPAFPATLFTDFHRQSLSYVDWSSFTFTLVWRLDHSIQHSIFVCIYTCAFIESSANEKENKQKKK